MIRSWILKIKKYQCGVSKGIYMFSVFFFLFSLANVNISACNEKSIIRDTRTVVETGLSITNVLIPSNFDICVGEDIKIMGKGFSIGDKVRLSLSSNSAIDFLVNSSVVTNEKIEFSLPSGAIDGKYTVNVMRGEKSLMLGFITLTITADETIPNIKGMTIKGVVSSDGKGLEDVVVSDGYEITTTDADGTYYLPSKKKNGYVFISVPGNYEVSNNGSLPQFFKHLSGGDAVEQKDFVLSKTDNNNHVIIGMADWHLADQNDDLKQFNNRFVPDLNETISEYAAKGVKVYGIALGDISWDYYWYRNNFGLPEYLEQMNNINCPIFNVMGNHDHDPYVEGDWESAAAFRNTLGPNYYSYNLGNVHYVVLDNTEWINTGGKPGVMGARNNNSVIVKEQMEWLKKDLATINDKSSPLIISMHVPLFGHPEFDANGIQKAVNVRLEKGDELISILNEFSNVHLLAGHTHVNFTNEASSSLIEHTIASVCGTSWWTGKDGFPGNHICWDGSPGGYGVLEIHGEDIEWYYKSIGYNKEYQFRTYDLNNVHITAAKFAPNSNNATISEYVGKYAQPNNRNEVLINVWGYEPKWEVEVRENGKLLNVECVEEKDPLQLISLTVKQLDKGDKNPKAGLVARSSNHFFKVKATSPTSILNVKVTDRFGNVYKENMERPKNFTYMMM